MKNLTLCLLLFLLGYLPQSNAQDCQEGESNIVITVGTDWFPQESSFRLFSADSVYYDVDFGEAPYQANTQYEFKACIPEESCVSFVFQDQVGDGFFGPGFFNVSINGTPLFENPNVFSVFTQDIDCPPGTTCNSAIPVVQGTHLAPNPEYWYSFSPDSVGTYSISTCNLNTCDTKIWVYDTCNGLIKPSNEGTVFYDDNAGGCGLQAQLNAILDPTKTYYIRIGDANDNCGNEAIGWTLTFNGPVVGCTDPTACNYDPLASVDDGSCIAQGDPSCPDGPDLILLQDALVSSLELTTINTNEGDCYIQEDCLQGYGVRDIIRFTTHIQNIGELDYFIGDPINNPDQFSFGNCHGHAHYDGYAEYLLFDDNGNQLPIGVKNGFCVLDLECDNGGNGKYGCSFMGISAGCGDIYDSYLDCQWVDITDVPDGRYTLVTRVNWDNAPDAAGRIEKDKENNWAQACVIIDRSSGEITMQVDPVCETYVDCEGTLYGPVTEDCTGECGGLTLMGDLDADGEQEMEDAQNYVIDMLGNDIVPTSCNDLNADNQITVYDAALLSNCLNFGAGHTHVGGGSHNHCNFPDGVFNINHEAALTIENVNEIEKYVDIYITNPTRNIVAYQFKVSGIVMASVENLVDPQLYNISPKGNFSGMVAGISYENESILKSSEPQPLCRIRYQTATATEICIENIVDIVDLNYEQLQKNIEGSCWLLSPTSTNELANRLSVRVQPNPFDQKTKISFNNPNGSELDLELIDLTGKVIRQYGTVTGTEIWIERKGLPAGMYYFRLSNGTESILGKLSIL
ncbi:MAG: lysyl oxidase family protein [Bacteroidota bacterium]